MGCFQQPKQFNERFEFVADLFPALGRPPQAARRLALGRRAPDGRHGPRAHDGARGAPARRAVRRPLPRAAGRGVRARQGDQQGRRHDDHGRAERRAAACRSATAATCSTRAPTPTPARAASCSTTPRSSSSTSAPSPRPEPAARSPVAVGARAVSRTPRRRHPQRPVRAPARPVARRREACVRSPLVTALRRGRATRACRSLGQRSQRARPRGPGTAAEARRSPGAAGGPSGATRRFRRAQRQLAGGTSPVTKSDSGVLVVRRRSRRCPWWPWAGRRWRRSRSDPTGPRSRCPCRSSSRAMQSAKVVHFSPPAGDRLRVAPRWRCPVALGQPRRASAIEVHGVVRLGRVGEVLELRVDPRGAPP